MPLSPYIIFATVDGVHFPIDEFVNFTDSMFSHKIKHAAVAYEVVVSIYTSEILSINGPFQASTNDLTMFRDKVKNMIPDGKKVLGDLLYKADEEREKLVVVNDEDDNATKIFKQRCLNRHETINKRLTDYGVLRQRFCGKRNKLHKHGLCFKACAALVQYSIQMDEPLFDV